jgi:pantoate--beta-alanine ligase
MSSRNSYLDAESRRSAVVLSRTLFRIRDAFRAGERRVESLTAAGRAVLDAERAVALDYLAIADGATLEPVGTATPTSVAMIAARVGRTRLIDNVVLGG